MIRNGWFTEENKFWPGSALSLQVEKILYTTKSQYQDIMVLQTKSHGRALILDGIIQCTERDEFAYQEMISFLPLCSHKDPETVLIVGGGDGGVAREVAKYTKVRKIYQVEIDEMVIETSKKFLPFMARGLSDPKVKLCICDGYEFLKQRENAFDVIITDSSDPVGPAMRLFEKSYFKLLRKALKTNGIICSQAGTIWTNLNQVKATLNHCKLVFPTVGFGISSIPTYPTGQIGYVLGSVESDTNFEIPLRTFTEEELINMNLRYYCEKVHRSCFTIPRFAEKELKL